MKVCLFKKVKESGYKKVVAGKEYCFDSIVVSEEEKDAYLKDGYFLTRENAIKPKKKKSVKAEEAE